MLKRIMLSYVDITTGHKRAAQSIHKTLKHQYPGIEILEFDPLKYLYPLVEKVIGKIYIQILKLSPNLWGYVYDNEKIVKLTAKSRKIFDSLNSSRLNKLFSSFNPQVVICTHAFSCGIFSALKEKTNNGFHLIGIITDFDVHNYWIHKNVSFYVVANEYSAKKLQEKGIDKERIKILGIPIDPVFTENKNIKELKKKYNLREDIPTILVMGGGWGFGPIEKIVHHLNDIKDIEFQIIVVTGTNKELKSRLIKLAPKLPKLTQVFGYVDVIDELMKVSDIFISKPGGMTSAESLACKLPMIIINPIPGQEDRNTRFLTSQGVAIRTNSEFEISKIVLELLTQPQKLDEMRSRILEISKPKSAFNIVKMIEEIVVFNERKNL